MSRSECALFPLFSLVLATGCKLLDVVIRDICPSPFIRILRIFHPPHHYAFRSCRDYVWRDLINMIAVLVRIRAIRLLRVVMSCVPRNSLCAREAVFRNLVRTCVLVPRPSARLPLLFSIASWFLFHETSCLPRHVRATFVTSPFFAKLPVPAIPEGREDR